MKKTKKSEALEFLEPEDKIREIVSEFKKDHKYSKKFLRELEEGLKMSDGFYNR